MDLIGWIKIHRSINNWEWRSEPLTFCVFINLLIEASFVETTWRGVHLKPGDVVFGRDAFSKRTGISEQSIRTALKRLKSTNEITIKSTNKYSVISINNWDRYQSSNQLDNQQSTNNQPATNHILINKENKKKININNIPESTLQEIANKFNVPLAFVKSKYEDMINWHKSTGKIRKDWVATLRNFVKTDALKRIDYAKQSNQKRGVDLSNL